MPYCPRCDMEFVEGITTCSDCGGPLVESEEAARAMKLEEEKKKALEAAMAHNPYGNAFSNEKAATKNEAEDSMDNQSSSTAAVTKEASRPVRPASSYVKKSQKYEDRKSSAFAFFFVGGIFTAFALLCWLGILDMPMYGFSKYLVQGTITVIGVGSLIIAVNTLKGAKTMAGEIESEEKQTEEIIQWFLSSYKKEDLERKLGSEFSGLVEEELSLKRFELIQDLLVTGKDLPDPAYVDALCEEIYEKLYEM